MKVLLHKNKISHKQWRIQRPPRESREREREREREKARESREREQRERAERERGALLIN